MDADRDGPRSVDDDSRPCGFLRRYGATSQRAVDRDAELRQLLPRGGIVGDCRLQPRLYKREPMSVTSVAPSFGIRM